MASWRRTHTCGELREQHIGQSVVLNGWVNTTRAYNDQVFIDLRDRYGVTQVVFESDRPDVFGAANNIGREFVLSVQGEVAPRLPDMENPDLATGRIEVKAQSVQVLNSCPRPDFEVTEYPGEQLANEDLRLKHRYLDLRRPSLQRTLVMRHKLNKAIRDFLDAEGFLELETPLLGRSTPEGARDYLVPSRIHHDEATGRPHWYALPQSPQLYKQLLMVAGYDRYFQIARCLRDEDTRADRQPEFTQLDLEMSFVEQDDVLGVIERLTADVFRRCLGVEVPLPLPRLKYEEAMLRYGSDKPDLRYALEIVDIGELAARSGFTVFTYALASGGVVRAINARGGADKFSNAELNKKLPETLAGYGARGLAWMKVEAERFTGSIEKYFPPEVQAGLRERLGAQPGDLLLFVADSADIVCSALGALRTQLAVTLKRYANWWDRRAVEQEAFYQRRKTAKRTKQKFTETFAFQPRPEEFQVAWVVDFPSFLWDEEEKRWVANHHPFTAPQDQYLDVLKNASAEDLTDPNGPLRAVRAKAYDLVINGYEIGGGSVRIHNPEVQAALFRVLGMSDEQARQRFGFLLDALKCGAPPHGGIALGLDRLTMILSGTTNIRDVIAFPKNQRARDLMTGAPAPVDARQLKELGL